MGRYFTAISKFEEGDKVKDYLNYNIQGKIIGLKYDNTKDKLEYLVDWENHKSWCMSEEILFLNENLKC